MNKRKIAAIILATMITNLSATTIDVLAQELNTKNNSKVQVSHDDESHQARVSKFDLYNSDKLDAYNQEFQVSRSNIKSITNNGGKYNSSTIDKAIDGNLETHWETGKPNDANFTNEVIVTLNEITNIDRIVYSARRDSARGKGFCKGI